MRISSVILSIVRVPSEEEKTERTSTMTMRAHRTKLSIPTLRANLTDAMMTMMVMIMMKRREMDWVAMMRRSLKRVELARRRASLRSSLRTRSLTRRIGVNNSNPLSVDRNDHLPKAKVTSSGGSHHRKAPKIYLVRGESTRKMCASLRMKKRVRMRLTCRTP